jgi:plastocyanin
VRRLVVTVVLIALVFGASTTRASAAGNDVHIVNGAPNPAELTIQEGDTVTFVNDDDVAHAIFVLGEQRGRTIAPHTRSDPFGPFQTGGQGGRSDYQVDQGGSAGAIIIAGPSTTTTSTTATTTAPPTTAATTTTAKPTTTTTSTTTTATSTTTTAVPGTASSSRGGRGQGTTSSKWLAVFGGVLGLVGIGNMIRVITRPKFGRNRQA